MFEIYSNSRTIVALKNPVEIKIMNLLNNGNKSFKEIVNYTKKSKSTISNCLERLEKQGLIASTIYSSDSRKKFYSSKSFLIGKNQRTIPDLFRNSLKNFNSVEDAFGFMNSLFKSFRAMLFTLGIDTKPFLTQLGLKIGNEISKKIDSKDIDGIIIEIQNFFKKNKLGNLELLEKYPLTLRVTDCYQCSDMVGAGKTLCSFDEGIFKSIFDQNLNRDSIVKEVECYGTGHNNCKFVVLFKD
jgi:hypothetical protein